MINKIVPHAKNQQRRANGLTLLNLRRKNCSCKPFKMDIL